MREAAGERTIPLSQVLRHEPEPVPVSAGQGRAEGLHRAQRPARERTERGAWAGSASAAASRSPTGRAASIARPASRSACSPPSSRPTRTQRKLMRRHADLEVSACKPWTTEEQYELLRRYLAARHPGGGMAEMDESDFADMVEQTPVRTYRHRISRAVGGRRPGQAGRRLPHRPAERRPVDDLQLLRCRARRRARGSGPSSSSTISSAPRAPACPTSISAIGSKARPRMAYKTGFRPLERLGRDGWRRMDEA